MRRRRILALDGGGIKGVFPAAFLSYIEESLPLPVGSYFDLIVGTSTGGILAIGLGLGFKARDLLRFYEDNAAQIFSGSRVLRALRSIGVCRYSAQPLRETLTKTFGDRRLGDSRSRLVIPSLDLQTGRVHIFKTAHHERFQNDYREPVVEVALATAAAPTYFPTLRHASGLPLVDGGVWANNPVAVAVVEALAVLEWHREDFEVLSIGCTASPFDAGSAGRFDLGQLFWAWKLVSLFMSAQSSAALGMAQLLAGHGNVHRVCPITPAGMFGLDKISEIPTLRGLGYAEARHAIPRLRDLFFSDAADRFQPIYELAPAN